MQIIVNIFNQRVAVLIALIILVSNPVWFLWEFRFLVVLFFLAILVLILLPRLHNKKLVSQVVFTLPITVLFFLYFVVLSGLVGGFQTYLFASFIILLIHPLFYEYEKSMALKIITYTLASIVFVSLFFWLIHTYMFALPMLGGYISYYESKGMDSVIENYLVFIQVQHDFLIRFYSIFDEPGTLGTLSAFILYANKYDFRKKANIIILVGAIFTFSMAFYILFLIGLLIQYVNNVRRILLMAFGTLLVFSCVLYFFSDNITFQTTVLGRFSNIEASINNRESHYLDNYYSYFFSGSDVLYGKGRSFLVSNPILFEGQTYKFFIIEFGVLGLVIILITYIGLIRSFNLFQIGVLIIFFLSFVQRPFIAQSWQILLFILIINELNLPLNRHKDKYVTR